MTEVVRRVDAELNGRGRVLIRYSGTERKARVMVEGDDAQLVGEFANDIAEELKRSLAGG